MSDESVHSYIPYHEAEANARGTLVVEPLNKGHLSEEILSSISNLADRAGKGSISFSPDELKIMYRILILSHRVPESLTTFTGVASEGTILGDASAQRTVISAFKDEDRDLINALRVEQIQHLEFLKQKRS
jgi:hypothetical protein